MDRTALQQAALKRTRRVIVKVGSAVLTTERGLDLEFVDSLAGQIAALHDQGFDVVLVSSGAVAAGRGVICSQAHCPAITGMTDRQAASAVGQSRLMHAYDQAFEDRNKVSAQILVTRDDLKSRRRFLNTRNTFATLLEWRAIPVVNENDTVAVQELEYGDNDHLASLLLNLVEADLFVNLTSASGVYACNPDTNPGAQTMDLIDNISGLDLDGLCGAKTSAGSGGMHSKLMAARRAAQLGVPTLILGGRTPEGLTRAFSGEPLGTWITAEEKTVSRRKYWLAYNMEPSGAILIDAGAAKALAERGKSLLPAGIAGVDGNFGRGALVRILRTGPDGDAPLGVGLSNYKASDLKKILGKQCSDVQGILGYNYNEAVHRDNMLLDAAL